MASPYKYFSEHDRVVTTNELKELVLNVSGTDGFLTQSYPPDYFMQFASGSATFGSATKVFDATFARSSATTNAEYSNNNYTAEKNIYNQFSKILLGTNASQIQYFPYSNGDSSNFLHNCYFINFSRGQFKDEITPATFKLTINVSGSVNVNLVDSGSAGNIIYNSPSSRYSYLYATASSPSDVGSFSFGSGEKVAGMVFYEAGVAVVSPYIFSKYSTDAIPSNTNTYLHSNSAGILTGDAPLLLASNTIRELIVSSSIKDHATALHPRLKSVEYQATTELNSTIYFCRAYNHEFNYSSNPTYLNNSKIIVKNDDPETPPRAYITTVGLYNDDNQLLAVAKLSEPILKTPDNELIARVRLDW